MGELRAEYDTLVKEKEAVDNQLAHLGSSTPVSERPPKGCCVVM